MPRFRALVLLQSIYACGLFLIGFHEEALRFLFVPAHASDVGTASAVHSLVVQVAPPQSWRSLLDTGSRFAEFHDDYVRGKSSSVALAGLLHLFPDTVVDCRVPSGEYAGYFHSSLFRLQAGFIRQPVVEPRTCPRLLHDAVGNLMPGQKRCDACGTPIQWRLSGSSTLPTPQPV